MKSFASVALFGAALVAAAPLNEKRDIVWHTTWTEVTETVLTTSTKWVAPGSEVSAAAVNPGGDFHETAIQFSAHKPQYTHAVPSAFSFPSYSVPAYETPAAAAPTTSTIEAPAPVPTTSSSTEEAPAPAPTTSTSSTPAPPPPPPTTTSTYVAPVPTSTYVAPSPTTTSVYVAPTPSTTSVYVAPTPTSVYVAPAPTTTTTTPAAATTSSSSGSGSGSGSSSGASTYSDVDLTYYAPGMGSCGIVSTDSDAIVALAANTMTKTYGGGNPNLNPMCGKKISITANGVTKTATIVDTCPGCLGPTDLDLSPSLFTEFAAESVGRITGASWSFI